MNEWAGFQLSMKTAVKLVCT